MNEPRDTGGRLTVPPYTQRCGRCGQDWWDAHYCPAANAAVPLPATLPLTVRLSQPATLTDEQIDKLAVQWADAPASVRELGDGRTAEFWSFSLERLRHFVRAALSASHG